MIVTRNDFSSVVCALHPHKYLGLDTETTGLSITDRPFSLQIATGTCTYYFNFNSEPDHLGSQIPHEQILPRRYWERLQEVFNDIDKVWFAHNALFDMRMLGYVGIEIKGHVHCTMGTAKLIDNSLMRYSLDACLKRIGLAKLDEVATYVKKNKLYTMKNVAGKKVRKKFLHYQTVPFQMMVRYGEQDAEDVLALGSYQLENLPENPYPLNQTKYTEECALLHVVHAMSGRGLKVDRDYTQSCLLNSSSRIDMLKESISTMADATYKSGPLWLRDAFDYNGLPYDINPTTGNPTFLKEKIEDLDHPLVKSILELRHEEKFYGTYFHSFLYYSNDEGILFSSAHPSGTDTGRFSYSDPNLQNIPKVSNGPDPRRCFIPREGYTFLMVDYKQQEYRLMLDYAGDTDLIAKVNDGMDVHTATAELMDVDRKTAKTLNFMLLYGGGSEKLAHALGISKVKGEYLKNLYFRKLPKVSQLIRQVIRTGKARGHIYNWAGRILKPKHFSEAYKLPNYLIQSSGADVIKKAMIQIHAMIKSTRSHLILTVHDELIFEIADGDDWLIDPIVSIMENVYIPFNGIKLECDYRTSKKSWSENE